MILDLSNYDFDHDEREGNEGWAREMRKAGVTGVILGCQNERKAFQQAVRLRSAGIPILGTYCYLYFGLSVRPEVEKAIRIATEFKIPVVWIDVEAVNDQEAVGMTSALRIGETHQAVNLVRAAGLIPGIYTAAWYWPFQMANTREFSDLPLWHSAYWDDGREVRRVDYGGWTDVAVHQYTSTFPLLGRTRDVNYVFNYPSKLPEDALSDDDLIVLFAGREDRDSLGNTLPRDIRLTNARARYQEILNGDKPSVLEEARSASAVVNDPNTGLRALQAAVDGLDGPGLLGQALTAEIVLRRPS